MEKRNLYWSQSPNYKCQIPQHTCTKSLQIFVHGHETVNILLRPFHSASVPRWERGRGRRGHRHRAPSIFFLSSHYLTTSCHSGPLGSSAQRERVVRGNSLCHRRQRRKISSRPLLCLLILSRSNTPLFSGWSCLTPDQPTLPSRHHPQ